MLANMSQLPPTPIFFALRFFSEYKEFSVYQSQPEKKTKQKEKHAMD